jgi:phospho-N-acetylmuramoyl-pentapeptide-transferase
MEPSILKLGLALGILGIPFCAWASPRFAHFLRAKQHIRPEGPTTHGKKEGTPTMGGIIPIAWILVWGAIFLPFWENPEKSALVLASTVLSGLVGLLDDLRSQRKGRSTGFFPHQTILAQGVAAALLLPLAARLPTDFRLPFSALSLSLPLWGWIPLFVFAFLGTVNGVNLADGLDGLATGLFVLALLGLFPFLVSDFGLTLLAFLAVGAGLGFLWANAHPAQVFLGNVGSMALGGFIFGLAWSAKAPFFLPLLGGVFVLEALSVMLQVASFQLTGVRLFKMSPLHHHLEDVPVSWPHRLRSPNWPEPKVVARLWILGGIFALLALLASLP